MGGRMSQYMAGFKAKYNDDLYTGSMIGIFDLLTQAMAKAGSTDPVKVAAAMHGHKFKGYNGDMEMRKLDHQMQQTLFMTVWQKTDKKFPYSAENTGMTLAPVKTFEPYISSTPTSCQMKLPS
jgi:branched-chain amino acid transport system substrate-binding protein